MELATLSSNRAGWRVLSHFAIDIIVQVVRPIIQGFDQLGSNGTGVGPHGEEADAIAGGGGLGKGEAAAGEVRDDGADGHASLGSQSAG